MFTWLKNLFKAPNSTFEGSMYIEPTTEMKVKKRGRPRKSAVPKQTNENI